jgi:Tfp pilus assembly protein FimT
MAGFVLPYEWNQYGRAVISPSRRAKGNTMNRRKENRRLDAGFTLLELFIVIAIIMVVIAMGIPKFNQAITNYKLRAAAESAAWGIQSARYQALQKGYTFQMVINATNNTYQLQSKPTGASSFSNVGGTVPMSASPVTVGAATTIQFSPNGTVSATVGSQTITFSYLSQTETVTVTNYGSVTVTP